MKNQDFRKDELGRRRVRVVKKSVDRVKKWDNSKLLSFRSLPLILPRS